MSWHDEREKVRVKSLRKLIDLLEDRKVDYVILNDEYDLRGFLKYLTYSGDYMEISRRLHVDWRTAYDYIHALSAIAKLLLEE